MQVIVHVCASCYKKLITFVGIMPPCMVYSLSSLYFDNHYSRTNIDNTRGRSPEKLIIDRRAGEIIRLVASMCVHVCVCPFVCGRSPLVNRLTFALDFWHEGRP